MSTGTGKQGAEPRGSARAPRQYDPPQFASLEQWDALRALVRARWREALVWTSERTKAGLDAGEHQGLEVTNAVADLEGELGRHARPFTMTFTVLPVVDGTVRKVADDHFLIPERVFLSPEAHGVVRELVRPLA